MVGWQEVVIIGVPLRTIDERKIARNILSTNEVNNFENMGGNHVLTFFLYLEVTVMPFALEY